MSENTETPQHTILICTSCQSTVAAPDVRAALADKVPEGYAFRAVDCMAGCDRPRTLGLQAKDKTTYLFGDIESDEDIAAIAEFAHQYLQSDTGWTYSNQRPAALSTKTLARLPALNRGRRP